MRATDDLKILAMREKAKTGAAILIAALALGVAGDALLRVAPWGLNFTIWVGLLVVAIFWVGRRSRHAFAGEGRWFAAVLLPFSVAFLWRDSIPLMLLNVLALLVAFSLLAWRAQGGAVRWAGLVDYAQGAAIAGLNAAVGLLALLFMDVQWRDLEGDHASKKLLAVGRGVVIALPLLVVFGGLFAASDAVFEGFVRRVFDFPVLASHFLLMAFFTWVVAGYLRGALTGTEREIAHKLTLPAPRLGTTEVGIALGSLVALFLAFVFVQIRYLFGGAALVGVTPGLTYAQYARRGFFELTVAAALVLPVLLATHWLLGRENPRGERLFRALAMVQTLLVFVVMASALQRMRLYQQEYGLTELRVFTTAFMLWLAVVFLWFVATVLTGRRQSFAFGAMIAGFGLVAALQIVNPDALIARTNVARAMAGHRFDASYASELSADAAPVLADALGKLPDSAASPQDKGRLASGLLSRWAPPARADWRTWNTSRAAARAVVRSHEPQLRQFAAARNSGPKPPGPNGLSSER